VTRATADFEDGDRMGRFVVLHDREGTLHAISASAIMAACETAEGTILLVSAGRMVVVEHSLRTVLSWLEVGVR
jgi:hypothetical protein